MGALEFDNVVFGYGGSRLFDGVSDREHQLHRRPERLWEINACETCHGAGEADIGARAHCRARRVIAGCSRASASFRRVGAAARGADDDGARAGGVREVSMLRIVFALEQGRRRTHRRGALACRRV